MARVSPGPIGPAHVGPAGGQTALGEDHHEGRDAQGLGEREVLELAPRARPRRARCRARGRAAGWAGRARSASRRATAATRTTIGADGEGHGDRRCSPGAPHGGSLPYAERLDAAPRDDVGRVRRGPVCRCAAGGVGFPTGGVFAGSGRMGDVSAPSPAGPFAALPPQVDLPALEQEILQRWEADKVFARTLEGSADRPQWVLLRGAADGQRPAGHAPHRGARVQGRLPAVQDDAGLARPPPRRLGLPRPAGRDRRRAGARLRRQARHRALRHRGVQRPLPGVGGAARRLVLRAHPPDGLLGGHVHGLLDDGPRLHRERLVVAQADLRQGPARRGPPRRPVLPALRHRAVRPRGRPGVRDPHRPLGLRAAAGHQRRVGRQGRPARSGRRRRGRCRRTPPSRCTRTSPTSSPARGDDDRRGRRAAAGRRPRARTSRSSPARPGATGSG